MNESSALDEPSRRTRLAILIVACLAVVSVPLLRPPAPDVIVVPRVGFLSCGAYWEIVEPDRSVQAIFGVMVLLAAVAGVWDCLRMRRRTRADGTAADLRPQELVTVAHPNSESAAVLARVTLEAAGIHCAPPEADVFAGAMGAAAGRPVRVHTADRERALLELRESADAHIDEAEGEPAGDAWWLTGERLDDGNGWLAGSWSRLGPLLFVTVGLACITYSMLA